MCALKEEDIMSRGKMNYVGIIGKANRVISNISPLNFTQFIIMQDKKYYT